MAELSVATLNAFDNAAGRWDERRPVLRDQLVRLAPDAIAIQEAPAEHDLEELAAAMGEASMVRLPHPGVKALAVISTLPVESVASLDGLGSGDQALRVRFASFDLVTTHLLYRPTAEGGAIRLAQAGRLLEWLEADAESGQRPQILAGDFNATPSGSTIRLVKTLFCSAFEVVHGHEPEQTHPTELVWSLDAPAAFGVPELPRGPGTTIDYLFVDAAVEVFDAGLAFDTPSPSDPTLFPSDHVGLYARVRIP